MLTQLSITNFALIDRLDVRFGKGFTIITGETGSGKSIIIEALEMLLGERADLKALKNPAEKCIIEGEFDLAAYNLQDFFSQHEIDYSDTTIFRREINPQGKSRSFINDTPVNLAVLKELGAILVDVHSQHQTLDIGKSVNQFEFLDAYAGSASEAEFFRKDFKSLKQLEKQLQELSEMEKRSKLDLDYFQFQLQELAEAKLQKGELTILEEELQTLDHAGEIRTALQKGMALLGDEQQGILFRLRELRTGVGKMASFNSSIAQIDQRIEATLTELRDIEAELERMDEEILIDPSRAALLRERVNMIQSLLFKHRLQNEEELLQLQHELEAKVTSIGSLDDQLNVLRTQIENQNKVLLSQGEKLSLKRNNAKEKLAREVNDMLHSLSMPHAEFKVELSSSEMHVQGTDALRFLVKTNKGGQFAELSKVASGGEFSRLMLALKSILARVKILPTIIFDEIDTGVSGEVAHKMGDIMRKMGGGMQVFAITHLPQVAVKGNAHFKVYKQVSKSGTETRMQQLDQHQRIEEVAKMLSGDRLSDAAIANARELMEL